MDRLNERLEVARKALASFREALREPVTPMNRDVSIQRFEYTYEAVWNCESSVAASSRSRFGDLVLTARGSQSAAKRLRECPRAL